MGFFDFFRKKDGAYYLDLAQKLLEQQRWVDVRDEISEVLHRPDFAPEVRSTLEQAMRTAQTEIARANETEAGYSRKAGDFTRAIECLETAVAHCHDAAHKEHLEGLLRDARAEKVLAAKKPELVQVSGLSALEDEEDQHIDERFEVYLAALMPDVAERYQGRGRTFARAYVEAQEGEAAKAFELFRAIRPLDEEEAALIAFEQARILLVAGQLERALLMLDVAASERGSRPIFLNNHPSIAWLRYEALLGLGRLSEAADALRAGLKVFPDQRELRVALAGLLIQLRQFDEATPLLAEQAACGKNDPELYILRGRMLAEQGDHAGAAEVLEAGIKSCGCSSATLPHPLLSRGLVEIYLHLQREPQRIETLLGQLFQAQGGEVEWLDHFLRARFHHWQGREEQARSSWRLALEALPDPRDPRRLIVASLFTQTT